MKKLKLLGLLVFALSCKKESSNPCGKVESVNFDTRPTGMYVYFTKGNRANSTKVEYGPTGFTQGTGTAITTSDNYVDIDDLFPSTTYDVFLTGICSATENSNVEKVSSITTDPGTCTGTASVSFSQFSSATSLDLNFSYNQSGPYYYEVEYGRAGFALGSGTRVNTSTGSSSYLTINSLQANTAYDFYVRAVCSPLSPNDASAFIKSSYTTVGSCPKPTNLSSAVISGACNSGNGATYALSWSDFFNASSYTVCIVTQGGQPSATTNAYTVSQTGVTLSGMFCLWDAFYVRANCGNGESSDWAGPYFF